MVVALFTPQLRILKDNIFLMPRIGIRKCRICRLGTCLAVSFGKGLTSCRHFHGVYMQQIHSCHGTSTAHPAHPLRILPNCCTLTSCMTLGTAIPSSKFLCFAVVRCLALSSISQFLYFDVLYHLALPFHLQTFLGTSIPSSNFTWHCRSIFKFYLALSSISIFLCFDVVYYLALSSIAKFLCFDVVCYLARYPKDSEATYWLIHPNVQDFPAHCETCTPRSMTAVLGKGYRDSAPTSRSEEKRATVVQSSLVNEMFLLISALPLRVF